MRLPRLLSSFPVIFAVYAGTIAGRAGTISPRVNDDPSVLFYARQ